MLTSERNVLGEDSVLEDRVESEDTKLVGGNCEGGGREVSEGANAENCQALLTSPGEARVVEDEGGELDEAVLVGDRENSGGLEVRYA